MSWMQDLYRTYEACANAVGIDTDEHEVLLPIGHTWLITSIEISIRIDGTFINAVKDKGKGIAICAPCTADSEGRTSGVSPHPLFDQLKYIAGECTILTEYEDSEHYRTYVQNLERWCESQHSHPKIMAICSYVKKGTVLNDLVKAGALTVEDLQKTKKEKDKEKSVVASFGVRFRVLAEGEPEDRVWLDKSVREMYLQSLAQQEGMCDVCYASGDTLPLTVNHPKKIHQLASNAKLISSNDTTNFVYRGRFESASQAVGVSYEVSQKAHQALRWLISSRGYRCGTQAIVAWAIGTAPQIPSFHDDSLGLYETAEKSNSAKLIEAHNQTFIDYAKLLNNLLLGFGNVDKLRVHSREIAVVGVDAATPGRMAIKYYRRMGENEYLEHVVKWHDTCKWYQPYGRDKDGKVKHGYFIGAPSFDRIANAVLGAKRSVSDENYDKQKKSLRERLLHCVFDGERIPRDMVTSAVHRASNPLAYEKTGSHSSAERWRDWEDALCTACAMVRRYYNDYEGVDFVVALETQRTDRDYLYGRLLAFADKIEAAARYKQGTAKDDARSTNAIRYMAVYAQRPFRTWNTLFTQQLNPHIQQLAGAGWYLNQIEDIMALFEKGHYETDAPLSGKYLLGFFAQRQALRSRKLNTDKDGDGGETNELKPQN